VRTARHVRSADDGIASCAADYPIIELSILSDPVWMGGSATVSATVKEAVAECIGEVLHRDARSLRPC